jgi:hypothetical protein
MAVLVNGLGFYTLPRMLLVYSPESHEISSPEPELPIEIVE